MDAQRLVLVVDDDETIRTVMCEVLSDAGYDAVGAADGAEALNRLRGGCAPCVILLDLMMPNMNGWQFRDAQRRDPELAKICTAVMTAAPNLKRPIEADHFLAKPIQLDDVLRVIEGCCEHQARRAEAAS